MKQVQEDMETTEEVLHGNFCLPFIFFDLLAAFFINHQALTINHSARIHLAGPVKTCLYLIPFELPVNNSFNTGANK